MIALEVGNLNGLFIIILIIMFGPPLLFATIGFFTYKSNRKSGKVLFILAALYLLIGLGICGSMLV